LIQTIEMFKVDFKKLKKISETFFEYLRSNLFGRVLFIFVCL